MGGGFNAKTRAEEVRCQGEQVSVLMETEDVTPQVTKALAAASGADAARVRNETITKLEEGCEAESATGTPTRRVKNSRKTIRKIYELTGNIMLVISSAVVSSVPERREGGRDAKGRERTRHSTSSSKKRRA